MTRTEAFYAGILAPCIAAQLACIFATRTMALETRSIGAVLLAVREDCAVVFVFALVALAILFACSGHGFAKRVAGATVITLASVHCLLMAINVVALHWLAHPISWQWIYYSDFFRSATPLRSVLGIVDSNDVAGMLAATAAPAGLVALTRAVPPPRGAFFRGDRPLLLLVGFVALVLSLGSLGGGRPEVDGRNPALVLAKSYIRSGDRILKDVSPATDHSDYRVRPPLAAAAAPPGVRRDILLVVLESVGAQALETELPRLPTFRSLAEKGVRFDHATVTVANSTRSNMALFYSRMPLLQYQVEQRSGPREGYVPLTLPLRDVGYRTLMVMSGDLAFDRVSDFLRATRFGPTVDLANMHCDDRVRLSDAVWTHVDYVPDRCAFAAASAWLLHARQPAFLTIWTGETHFPYSPQGKKGTGRKSDYLAALRNADRQLGELLEEMRRAGRPDPTVIVVGDHGEAFGEHGDRVHSSSIWHEQVDVPLIIVAPGFEAGSRRHDMVQLVDIPPTVMAIAGAARPAGWQGFDLTQPSPRKNTYLFSLSNVPVVGIRTRESKYVFQLSSGTLLRFDLRADPEEVDPMQVDDRERRRILASIAGWKDYNAMLAGKRP